MTCLSTAETNRALSLISTMETEIVASRNVVDQLFADQYDTSLCPGKPKPIKPDLFLETDRTLATTEEETTKDYVYGWDC